MWIRYPTPCLTTTLERGALIGIALRGTHIFSSSEAFARAQAVVTRVAQANHCRRPAGNAYEGSECRAAR
jgi:hypothetical protein